MLAHFSNDMRDVTVVFPGKRAGMFLNREFAALSDKPVWTPHYCTMGDLFQSITSLQVADPLKCICLLHNVMQKVLGADYTETLDEFWSWGEVLMSDFDGHKADCLRHIAINHKEEALRDAISDYLVNEIGKLYQKSDLCIPVLMMIHEERDLFMGDFWVFWYEQSGDTLKCISGGNHAGCMTLSNENGQYKVTSFDQTVDGAGNDASAQRIFGSYYDIYQNIHSNERIREAVRQEQLRYYLKRHNLNAHYYQDYGWPVVEI